VFWVACRKFRYEKATFCYEELLMALPQNYHLYVRYADLLYSIGGLDNLEMARKYYSFALELSTENNIKALYGLALVR
jgi:tetratricopeptide (TPR) repeat protein